MKTVKAPTEIIRFYGEVSFDARSRKPTAKAEAELAEGSPEDIEAIEKGTAGRRLEIDAYHGGIINIGWGFPVVLDLSRMEIKRGRFPGFFQHEIEKIVGFVSKTINTGVKLSAEVMTVSTEWAREVLRLADEGYPWQASVGADPVAVQFFEDGESFMANGRQFTGPCYFVASRLRELSIVYLGADSDTEVIAASRLKEEAKLEDSQMDKAEIAKIREEFREDPGFALQAIDEGKSLVEAKAAYADLLKDKNKALESELKQERARASAPPAADPIKTLKASSAPQDEAGTFAQKVEEQMKAGKPRNEAVRIVARKHPDLHRQMIAAANGGAVPKRYEA